MPPSWSAGASLGTPLSNFVIKWMGKSSQRLRRTWWPGKSHRLAKILSEENSKLVERGDVKCSCSVKTNLSRGVYDFITLTFCKFLQNKRHTRTLACAIPIWEEFIRSEKKSSISRGELYLEVHVYTEALILISARSIICWWSTGSSLSRNSLLLKKLLPLTGQCEDIRPISSPLISDNSEVLETPMGSPAAFVAKVL